MQIIDQSWEWLKKPTDVLETIERAGRTCYKSECRITEGSAEKFTNMIIRLGHETVIEHVGATVRFITNRGVTHELVRHRMASFSQESTRYVRYSDGLQFIRPVWWDDEKYSQEQKDLWSKCMKEAEIHYLKALEIGDKPEQARELLPHSIKTEIVVTANLREWRHILKLRCSPKAHPQIVELMRSCLNGFNKEMPVIFGDLAEKYNIKEGE